MIDFDSILSEARSISFSTEVQLELVVQLLIVRELRKLNSKLESPPAKSTTTFAR